jgi:hypothetical protein
MSDEEGNPRWTVVCLDTFAGDYYGEEEFDSREEAEADAEERAVGLLEQKASPGLRDRVFITGPDGRRKRYLPRRIFTRVCDLKAKMSPREGFNLVRVDSSKEPGEDLFLVGQHATIAEAEQARKKQQEQEQHGDFHIYSPAEPAVPDGSEFWKPLGLESRRSG